MTSVLLEQQNSELIPAASEDDVGQYLQEIRQIPLLTAAEERVLAQRCAAGDESAMVELVNANLRLVVSVAREYAGRGVPLLDLIQEGSIGLLAAARKFDYSLDYRFSTYATKWIRQGVTRCLMNHGSTIRVPVHTAERMKKVIAARSALLQQLGREPSLEEIAEKAEISADKVHKYLSYESQFYSLDAPVGEDSEGSLGLILEDIHAPQPQQELIRRELKKTMDDLLSTLTQRQQQVLRLRFGMEDGVCHSLESIGKLLGLSKERCRQLEKQGIENLKKRSNGLGLEDFLE